MYQHYPAWCGNRPATSYHKDNKTCSDHCSRSAVGHIKYSDNSCANYCDACMQLLSKLTGTVPTWFSVTWPKLTPMAAITCPEPACSCPMVVGACVSIGHQASCAWQKWNTARKSTAWQPKDHACQHVWSTFRYLGGVVSCGAVCTTCREVACQVRRSTGNCKCTGKGEAGPYLNLGVLCKAPMPPNVSVIVR